MTVKNMMMTRGHIVLWLDGDRFVYMQGELTLGHKFYVDLPVDWYWIKKPLRNFYFLKDEQIIRTVTPLEKKDIIAAVNERNRREEFQIVFD